MKNNLKKTILCIFAFGIFCTPFFKVNAEIYTSVGEEEVVTGKEIKKTSKENICSRSYKVNSLPTPFPLSGTSIYGYNASNNGKIYGQTYCVAPGMTGPGGSTYVCEYLLDPETNDRYSIAMTIAYQRLVEEGFITNSPTSISRTTGTVLFRWIAYSFGRMPMVNLTSSSAWVDPNNSLWNDGDAATIKKLKAILAEAAGYGHDTNQTYENLTKHGIIWVDQWRVSSETKVDTTAGKTIISLTVKAGNKSGKGAPAKVAWDKFEFKCSTNKSINCNSKLISSSGNNSAKYEITIDKALPSETEVGITINSAYSDIKSPLAHMARFRTENTSDERQPMIIIKSYDSNILINSKIEYGTTTDEEHKCEYFEGKYYGPDGEPTDEKTYKDECFHVCEKPSPENGDKWYCQRESDTDGNGRECTEEEYITDCECPVLKDKCDNDPSDPACNEYDEKCPNCVPTITIPDDCADFDDNRIESTQKVNVGDINEISTACNNKVNQIKKCVLDKKDLAGNSLEATSIIKNNPYCKVWCKENFTFDLPTAKYSTSGGYFTISAKVNGTRDCYVSNTLGNGPIDEEKFNKDIENNQQNIINSWNEMKKWQTAASIAAEKEKTSPKATHKFTVTHKIYVQAENSLKADTETTTFENKKTEIDKNKENAEKALKAAIKKYDEIIANYKNCSAWTNDMNFNPEIEFSYNEDYMNQMDGVLKQIGNTSTSSKEVYCTGKTDDEYNCVSGETSTVGTKEIEFISCDNNGCAIRKEGEIPTAKWVQKSVSKEANYAPSNEFSTYTQYGIIKLKEPRCSGKDCLWTRLPDEALPVALITKTGVFPFTFKMKNIGQYGDNSGNLGRLMGNDNSVIVKYAELSDNEKCGLKGKDIYAERGYVCHYLNNCDNCDFKCEGDNCEFTTCEGDNCDVTCDDPNGCDINVPECDGDKCTSVCENCIFDGGESQIQYRPVSLGNMFPNSSSNAATTQPENNTREPGYNWNATKNKKASATIETIEEQAETAYEDKLQYSYTLSPAQMQNIREYNASVGSYQNTQTTDGTNAIKCDTENYNGLDYQVRCTSSFLDTNGTKYFTVNERNDSFTLWTETDYCQGGSCLSRKDGIGPSWK